jgi:ribose-phosphate pyrophosphokinase
MRQDTRFRPGEGVTSAYFASLLGGRIDWLVTMDPHLHRRKSLAEIYGIPTAVSPAGSAIGDWIQAHVTASVVVGPDSESEQWVAAVAERAKAPYYVLQKTRLGDRDVKVSMPNTDRWKGRTPVLVDDIVSTARTMIAAATQFREIGFDDIVAIGVHALFAGTAYQDLQSAGVTRIVTCDTVRHPSNGIDIADYLAAAVQDVAHLAGRKRRSNTGSSPIGPDQA